MFLEGPPRILVRPDPEGPMLVLWVTACTASSGRRAVGRTWVDPTAIIFSIRLLLFFSPGFFPVLLLSPFSQSRSASHGARGRRGSAPASEQEGPSAGIGRGGAAAATGRGSAAGVVGSVPTGQRRDGEASHRWGCSARWGGSARRLAIQVVGSPARRFAIFFNFLI